MLSLEASSSSLEELLSSGGRRRSQRRDTPASCRSCRSWGCLPCRSLGAGRCPGFHRGPCRDCRQDSPTHGSRYSRTSCRRHYGCRCCWMSNKNVPCGAFRCRTENSARDHASSDGAQIMPAVVVVAGTEVIPVALAVVIAAGTCKHAGTALGNPDTPRGRIEAPCAVEEAHVSRNCKTRLATYRLTDFQR